MRFAPLLLAAVCALVLFTGLGRIGLIDQREARDAEVAREMVVDKELFTPILGHEPLFEKPLLAYAPELAARLTSRSFDTRSRQIRAAGAVLLLILTMFTAAQHFGARAAWCTGLALATSLGFPLASRTDGTQIFATTFGWLGCTGLARAVFGRSAGRGRRLVVGYGALGLALVFAGPLPALWPLLGLAIYLGLARQPDGWRRSAPIAGLTLMAGIGIPYYGAMCERHGAALLAHEAFFPSGAEP